MKTILVLIGGGDRDQVVSETAMAAARPLSAHLDFLHIRVRAGEKPRTFSKIAASTFRDFYLRWQLEVCDAPARTGHGPSREREPTIELGGDAANAAGGARLGWHPDPGEVRPLPGAVLGADPAEDARSHFAHGASLHRQNAGAELPIQGDALYAAAAFADRPAVVPE
jgi:hypothetical protein